MKLTTLAAAAALALAPSASAWRVYLYSFTDFSGSTYTAAGPGNPGTACRTADPSNRNHHRRCSQESMADISG